MKEIYVTERRYCPVCDTKILSQKGKFNHLKHIIICIIFPVWMIFYPWMYYRWSNDPWKCVDCDSVTWPSKPI